MPVEPRVARGSQRQTAQPLPAAEFDESHLKDADVILLPSGPPPLPRERRQSPAIPSMVPEMIVGTDFAFEAELPQSGTRPTDVGGAHEQLLPPSPEYVFAARTLGDFLNSEAFLGFKVDGVSEPLLKRLEEFHTSSKRRPVGDGTYRREIAQLRGLVELASKKALHDGSYDRRTDLLQELFDLVTDDFMWHVLSRELARRTAAETASRKV